MAWNRANVFAIVVITVVLALVSYLLVLVWSWALRRERMPGPVRATRVLIALIATVAVPAVGLVAYGI